MIDRVNHVAIAAPDLARRLGDIAKFPGGFEVTSWATRLVPAPR